MHKITFLGVLIAASCVCADLAQTRALPALLHEEIHDQLGQYALRYVTAEGTIVVEKGHLVPNPDGKGHVMEVEGEVTYVGDDGKTYKTVYTAGLNGYRVVGEHLPVSVSASNPESESH